MSNRRVSSFSRLLRLLMAIAIAAMVIPIGPAQALAAPAPFALSASPSPVGVPKGTLLAAAPTAAPAAASNVGVTLTNNSGSTRTVKVEVVADAAAKTHVQAWLMDSTGTWYNSIVDGFGPANGFSVPDGYTGTSDFYVMGDQVGTYSATLNLVDATTHEVLATTSITAVVGAYTMPVLMPVWRFYNMRTRTHFYTADATEHDRVINTLSSIYRLEGITYNVNTANPQNCSPLWRFYNKVNGSHFYTADPAEMARIRATMTSTYSYEGPAYNVCLTNVAGCTTVWRFFNVRTGTHFYTADAVEKANVMATLGAIYHLDGPAFYLVP